MKELSPREVEALELLIDDKVYKQAATAMGIVKVTFQHHVSSAKRKLGVKTPLRAAVLYDRARR